jgi:hypothetical protein
MVDVCPHHSEPPLVADTPAPLVSGVLAGIVLVMGGIEPDTVALTEVVVDHVAVTCCADVDLAAHMEQRISRKKSAAMDGMS